MFAAPPAVTQAPWLQLAGNPATTAAVLTLLDTVDATALRRLHPAVAAVISALPWCDQTSNVVDVVRWRAAFPAALGAQLTRLDRTPAAIAAALAGLTYLDLSECEDDVTDEIICLLPPSLQTLNILGCNGLTDAASFAHLPALAILDCSYTKIRNAAIATLPPSLQVLRARFHCVLAGVEDFRHLVALRTLEYEQCGVCIRGTRLPSSLEDLMLVCIHIQARAAPLAHLTALRTLCLELCRLPPDVLATLPPSIESLVLQGCVGLPESSFSCHPPLPVLRSLSCRGSDLGTAMIATLPPALVDVEISGYTNHLGQTTSVAAFPAHMPALATLRLCRVAIGNVTIACLPASLTQLTLEHCVALTPAASLDHLVNLTSLNCTDTPLAPSTLAACRARGCAIIGP